MSSQAAPEGDVDADPKVLEAFALGWNVAELFHGRIPASTPDRSTQVPDKLPGVGDLDDLARARLLLAEVTAGVHRVCPFDEHGLPAPDLTPLRESMDAPARSRRDVRLAIAALHSALLSALTAADFRLGKAYGLGRALAETTMLPRAENPDTFGDSFHPFRLRRLEAWLSDLKSAFPAHAAEGVRGSVQAWASWVRQPRMEIWSEPDGKVAGSRRIDPTSTADRRRVDRAIRRQGQVWRAMLSGEKLGVDLLSTEHYIEAAEHLVDRLGDLVGRFLKRYRLWVAGAVVLVVAVTAAAVVLSRSAAVVTGLAAAAGAVGLSWKGVGGTLGKALARAEKPLWEAELDAGIVIAATRLPQEVRRGAAATKAPEPAAAEA